MPDNTINMGADPEFFVVNRQQVQATSIHLLEKREKTNNYYFGRLYNESVKDWKIRQKEERKKLYLLDPDGFAIEAHPTHTICRDELRNTMYYILTSFHTAHPDYKLSAIPRMQLNKSSLTNAPDDVMGYGCVPDFNAYTLEEKSPDISGYHSSMRYIGGHLHFETGKLTLISAAAIAIIGDIFLGLPLVAILGETNNHHEAERRRYYGQAGSFRQPVHGFEYRVPSSALFMSPILMSWGLGALRRALLKYRVRRHKNNDAYWIELIEKWDKEFNLSIIQNIINNHDVQAAIDFVKANSALYADSYYPQFYRIMLEADKRKLPINTDLEASWQINIDNIQIPTYTGVEQSYSNASSILRKHEVFPPFEVLHVKSWAEKAREI